MAAEPDRAFVDLDRAFVERVWTLVGGAPEAVDAVELSGPSAVLPAVFDVTGLAGATVAAATLAAAEFLATRTGEAIRAVTVDYRAASAAFLSEVLFTPIGWERPPVWDLIAGVYETADGSVRLHTNYRYHRAAVESVLGACDRAAVATAVRRWAGADLETAVVGAGGCAAVLYDRSGWLAHPAGAATADEPAVRTAHRPAENPATFGDADRPFTGIRVLDLTRVIAGPVATRFLAGYGADVLRIDPPGFVEVPALVPETSTGKHCATLDLADSTDRAVFDSLVREAHVLITGLRPGAIARLGYDRAALLELNPTLVTAALDAYGWDGPWADRRGFDSLVQMSCGIAAAGAAAGGSTTPVPLPAQALDHGTVYLLAATIGRALTERARSGGGTDIRCSLIGTANLLLDHPTPNGLATPAPAWTSRDTVATTTGWGAARRVPLPGSITGVENDWRIDAGPLGRHVPRWSTLPQLPSMG